MNLFALIYTMKYLTKIWGREDSGGAAVVQVLRFQNTPLMFQSFRGSVEFSSDDNTRNSDEEKQK